MSSEIEKSISRLDEKIREAMLDLAEQEEKAIIRQIVDILASESYFDPQEWQIVRETPRVSKLDENECFTISTKVKLKRIDDDE